jgi:hypothetical protein
MVEAHYVMQACKRKKKKEKRKKRKGKIKD